MDQSISGMLSPCLEGIIQTVLRVDEHQSDIRRDTSIANAAPQIYVNVTYQQNA